MEHSLHNKIKVVFAIEAGVGGAGIGRVGGYAPRACFELGVGR